MILCHYDFFLMTLLKNILFFSLFWWCRTQIKKHNNIYRKNSLIYPAKTSQHILLQIYHFIIVFRRLCKTFTVHCPLSIPRTEGITLNLKSIAFISNFRFGIIWMHGYVTVNSEIEISLETFLNKYKIIRLYLQILHYYKIKDLHHLGFRIIYVALPAKSITNLLVQ